MTAFSFCSFHFLSVGAKQEGMVGGFYGMAGQVNKKKKENKDM